LGVPARRERGLQSFGHTIHVILQPAMSAPTPALDDLVTANRILAREGVVDSFGHVSIRHPDLPDRHVLSRARAPECIEVEDLMEFARDGTPIDPAGRKPYAERFIHGAVYDARPEVRAI